MLTSYRWSMAGMAALVVLCGICRPAAAADLKYLPKDTQIVVTVNVRQILDSALVKSSTLR